MTDYPAPPTSLLWPVPADVPSITSMASDHSSQRTQHNSWSKRWSFPIRASANRSWLGSPPLFPPHPWPPLASCCSLHSIQYDDNGLKASTALHPSTSKHWSDLTPQHEHLGPLHQLAGWHHHHSEQRKVAQRSHNSSLFWSLSGGMNCWPITWQQSHPPSSAKDSLVQTSHQPRIAWLPLRSQAGRRRHKMLFKTWESYLINSLQSVRII